MATRQAGYPSRWIPTIVYIPISPSGLERRGLSRDPPIPSCQGPYAVPECGEGPDLLTSEMDLETFRPRLFVGPWSGSWVGDPQPLRRSAQVRAFPTFHVCIFVTGCETLRPK